MLPTWLYSYKDYSCRGNLDGSHSFDGESSSKSMLLLLRRHLVFRFLFFYDKIGFFFFSRQLVVKELAPLLRGRFSFKFGHIISCNFNFVL